MERDLERLRNGTPREKFAAGVNAIRLGAVTSGRDDQVRFLANQLQEMDPSNAVVNVNGVEVNWITELRRSNPTMADDVYARLRERAERGDISSAQFAAYSQSFGFTPQGARLAAAEDRFSPAVVAAPNLDGAPTTGTGTAAPTRTVTIEEARASLDAGFPLMFTEATPAATVDVTALTGAARITALMTANEVAGAGAAPLGQDRAGLSGRLATLTTSITSPADLVALGFGSTNPDNTRLDANLTTMYLAANEAQRAAFSARVRELAAADPANAAAYTAELATMERRATEMEQEAQRTAPL